MREDKEGFCGVESVMAHKYFSGIDVEALHRGEITPPWKPTDGKLYVRSEALIESRNKEETYAGLVLGPEDDIEIYFTDDFDHQNSIIKLLEAKESGKIKDADIEKRCLELYGNTDRLSNAANVEGNSKECVVQ